jgi:hypothetical protein
MASPNSVDGPTSTSKAILLLASVVELLNDLPLTLWLHLLTLVPALSGCVATFFSMVDVVHVLYILAIMGYFLFIKREHDRVQESDGMQAIIISEETEAHATRY